MRTHVLASCVVLTLGGATSAGPAPAAAETKSVDDGDAWLTAHGSKAPKQLENACCCVEVSVGRPAESALDCKEEQAGGHPESADIAVKEVIRVVRGGKIVKVLEAWVGLQNLDWPPGSPHWIDLRLTVDRGGRTVMIDDPGGTPYGCSGRHGTDDFGVWVDRVCASRGTYRWRGGRFVRAAK